MKTSVAITPKNGRHFAIDFFSRIFLLEREEDDDDDRESLDGVPSIDDDFFFVVVVVVVVVSRAFESGERTRNACGLMTQMKTNKNGKNPAKTKASNLLLRMHYVSRDKRR